MTVRKELECYIRYLTLLRVLSILPMKIDDLLGPSNHSHKRRLILIDGPGNLGGSKKQ